MAANAQYAISSVINKDFPGTFRKKIMAEAIITNAM
jgi:hypothetical protein